MPPFDPRDDLEARLKKAILKTTEPQAAKLLRLLGDPPDTDNVPAVYWASLGDDLQAEIRPLLLETFNAGALNLLPTIPKVLRIDWSLANKPAADWAEKYSFELVKGINETSQAKLANYVSNFFNTQGTNIGNLKEQVATMFGEARAQAIAVTETTRAQVEGEKAIVKEIQQANPKVKLAPIFDTAMDERVCPVCKPRNGKVIKSPEGNPPLHPNCRCSIRYDVERK